MQGLALGLALARARQNMVGFSKTFALLVLQSLSSGPDSARREAGGSCIGKVRLWSHRDRALPSYSKGCFIISGTNAAASTSTAVTSRSVSFGEEGGGGRSGLEFLWGKEYTLAVWK